MTTQTHISQTAFQGNNHMYDTSGGPTSLLPQPTNYNSNSGNSNQACETYESIANGKFRLDAEVVKNSCLIGNSSICVLALTKQCTPNAEIIYGGFCENHNSIIRKIFPFNMYINGQMNIRQFSLERFLAPANFGILTSMLKIGTTVDEIAALLKYATISGLQKDLICKFYSELSYPVDSQNNQMPSILFEQYINILAASVITQLNKDIPNMQNICIQTAFSHKKMAQLSTNRWFLRINEKANAKQIATEVTQHWKIFYIPLTEFNMLDIMAIRAYYIDVQINQTGYIPNIAITNGQFSHGVGYGIINAINVDADTQSNCSYSAYPDDVAQAINNTNKITVTNLDPLVMSAVSNLASDKQTVFELPPFISVFSQSQMDAVAKTDYKDILHIKRNHYKIKPPAPYTSI